MKRKAILIAVVIINCLLVAWIILHDGRPVDVPPRMTQAQMAAVPDHALIHITFSHLRVEVEVDPAKSAQWRTLPEVARRTLVATWVEEQFTGFSDLLVHHRTAPFLFTADDLADAYVALGAGDLVDVVREAEKRAAEQPEPRDALKELDQRFRKQRQTSKVSDLLRVFIRSHQDGILSARL